MSIDRIFIVFAVALGLIVATVVVFVPASRDIGLSPYFWVLIAMGLFEMAAYSRGGGAPVITVQTRLVGFGIALALTFLIPMWAGVEVKLF